MNIPRRADTSSFAGKIIYNPKNCTIVLSPKKSGNSLSLNSMESDLLSIIVPP